MNRRFRSVVTSRLAVAQWNRTCSVHPLVPARTRSVFSSAVEGAVADHRHDAERKVREKRMGSRENRNRNGNKILACEWSRLGGFAGLARSFSASVFHIAHCTSFWAGGISIIMQKKGRTFRLRLKWKILLFYSGPEEYPTRLILPVAAIVTRPTQYAGCSEAPSTGSLSMPLAVN